jgi:Bacterial dnaA protein helix-turn-helix
MSTPSPSLSPPPLFAVPGICASAAAAVLGAPPQAIATRTRQAIIARARLFAIYLHHVALGESLSACARLFVRDRATVRYACARIEDMRDDPNFDFVTMRLETALMAQRDLALMLAAASFGEETTI